MIDKIKTKTELVHELQIIAEDVEKRKQEIEVLLGVIDSLEKKYIDIVEEIKNN